MVPRFLITALGLIAATLCALTLLTGCVGYVPNQEDEMIRDPATGQLVKDSWSTNVTLKTGDGSGLGTEPTANPKGKIQSLQINFPFSGDFTLFFDRSIIDPNPTGAITPAYYMAEAKVSYVCEGNLVTRRISVGPGATITGVAAGVKIQMWDVSPGPASAYPPGTAGLRYNVSVQVALGTRAAKQVSPQLTPGPAIVVPGMTATLTNASPGSYVVQADPVNGIEIPIPQDAGVVAVLVLAVDASLAHNVNIITGACEAQLLNSTSGQSAALWYPLGPQGAVWIPVPAGADTLAIFNRGAAGNVFTYTAFFLIDG